MKGSKSKFMLLVSEKKVFQLMCLPFVIPISPSQLALNLPCIDELCPIKELGSVEKLGPVEELAPLDELGPLEELGSLEELDHSIEPSSKA
jgi:hypothetical protein